MADFTINFTFLNCAGHLTDEAIDLLESHINSFEDGDAFTVALTKRVDDHRAEFRVESLADMGYGVATLYTDRVFRSFRDEYCSFDSDAPTDEQHTLESLSFDYTEDISILNESE